ncbi:MAG: hypothetical protein ACE5SW_11430 [Nitrososphaeraceae archaeon]
MNFYNISILCIIPILFILFLTTSITIYAFSGSPFVQEQEILDNITDWIDLSKDQITTNGERYTDIISVDYFSDGKSLNATLWLLFPFKENPPMQEVDYGMFIDSDFNSKTGYGGIDYKVEIQWDNETKKWNKVIERWSKYGGYRIIENITNYTNFYEEGLKYVTISADLEKLLYPQKYKVLFYADFRKSDGTLISDYTRWVAIPPLELGISTVPSLVELSRGLSDTIEVKINSTEGYAPTVTLSIENKPSETFLNFHFNELRLSSYGIATTPITITSSKDAPLGPHTFYIIAKSNFPPDELITVQGTHSIAAENIIKKSVVSLKINPEPDLFDIIQKSWEKIGNFTQFMYGVLAGISPWIYQIIRKIWTRNNIST